MNTPNAGNDDKRPARLSDDDMPLELALTDDPDLRLRIGRYLGGVRKLKQISQERVADDLKMSRPHLSNIEMGHSRTSWRGLRELARYYGYGMRTLIEETEKAHPPLPAPKRPPKVVPPPKPEPTPEEPPPVDDETFLVGLIRSLDAKDRQAIARRIMQLVQDRMKKVRGS